MSEHDSRSRGDAAARRLETAAKILVLTYTLAVVIYNLWLMVPAHQKRLWAMKITQKTRQATGTLAFRTGHQAMRHELASSVENYTLPYVLSLARDRAGRLYEKLRYTG